MLVMDSVFPGVLTGGFSRLLSVLSVKKSTPEDGKFRAGECVYASRVSHLHIHTSALKFHLLGSNPQR